MYLLAATETKRCYVTIKHLNLNFPQQCNLKVYSRWLWIFLSLKSPEEWEITKQACRDESVVFFLLPIFISRSTLTYQALYYGKIETQTSYIYIYIYVFFFLLKWRPPAENSTSFLHFSRNTDIEDPDGCLDTALKFLTAKFVYSELSLRLC